MSHVLLVEDDMLLAKHFMRVLEQDGMHVVHAPHAGAAIQAIDRQPPDVIVLDVLLPAVSGFSLLHELRTYEDTAAIPTVVCTTMADDMPLETLRSYGVDRLIDKATMQPADIVTAVRAMT